MGGPSRSRSWKRGFEENAPEPSPLVEVPAGGPVDLQDDGRVPEVDCEGKIVQNLE